MPNENGNDPTAQGTQPGDPAASAQTPATQPDQTAQQFAGIQKRFDEFTAKLGEERRTNEALMAQNQQLLTALTQRPQVDPYAQPVPPVDIDPAYKQQFDAMLAPILRRHEQQLAHVTGMATEGALGALIAGDRPEVQARARQLWNQVVANGDHLRGWTPQQAAVIARGEILPQLLNAAAQQHNQTAQRGAAFNAQPGALPTNSAPLPVVPQTTVVEPDPNDDPEGAAAYFEKKLAGKTF